MVEIPSNFQEGLFRLRLRRKYSAVLVKETRENLILLKTLRNQIAYGQIDNETLKELIAKRGQPADKKMKIDADSIVKQLDKKTLEEVGLKPFFRLHPPRGGIETKVHFGVRSKAVLGDNGAKINDLVRRML